MKIQIACAILAALAVLAGYCAAQSANSGSTTIDANLEGIFEMQVTPKITMHLANDQTDVETGDLTVTSNGVWNLKVSSDRDDGTMREYDTGSHEYNENAGMYAKKLGSPMQITCDDQHVSSLSHTLQNLIVGSTAIGTTHHAVTFTQIVGEALPGPNVDVHLDPGKIYRIVVIFTGSLQY